MTGLSENEYKDLLKIFNKLDEDNKSKKKKGIHDYSLMNALLKKIDEVHLHSNFIYSMINPRGNHYCDSNFLNIFLDSINESSFIDIDNARTHKEKGKIDLLVEDGEHYLIIENKLSAVDQPRQISRYIHYIIEKYLDKDDEKIHEKIRVVYLSEYKATPSQKSESIIGFELKDGALTRNDESVSELTLPKRGTKINFNRVQHSNQLYKWVEESKKYLAGKPNNEMLIYAFEEYRLILERLKSNNWRKIMSLDEYLLKEETKEVVDVEKMYKFMQESSRVLNDYSAKKLYRTINKLIKDNDIEKIIKDISLIKNDFTENACKKWFNKKGEKKNWRDVGLFLKYNKKNYILLLGIENIYIDKYDSNKDITEHKKYTRDEIFCVIKEFESMLNT
jgi:hypothetical protein